MDDGLLLPLQDRGQHDKRKDVLLLVVLALNQPQTNDRKRGERLSFDVIVCLL